MLKHKYFDQKFPRAISIYIILFLSCIVSYALWASAIGNFLCYWIFEIAMALHYSDVIMGAMASSITSLTIVYSTVYSGAYQRKHQSSSSLAFVWGIYRSSVNFSHKWPVTRKMFPSDDVIIDECYSYFFSVMTYDSQAVRKWETNELLLALKNSWRTRSIP